MDGGGQLWGRRRRPDRARSIGSQPGPEVLRPGRNSVAMRGFLPVRRAALRGFTLAELLVVIVIIGVLATLLLPALRKAKSSARRIECLSRMKQWSLALIAYKEDHEDLIPREGYRSDGDVSWNSW